MTSEAGTLGRSERTAEPAARVRAPAGAACALLALILLTPAAAQSPPPAATPSAVARTAVIGASMSAGYGSAGYGAPCTLTDAWAASLAPLAGAPLSLGDALFFVSPLATGAREVEEALAIEPTLVVAVDFLFWFGYGSFDAKGGPIEAESERLELLEKGLALLEEFECPLVLGDFPDMSAAVGKMITPEQLPARDTLMQLSARVRAWAEKRGRTIVLPLAELVKKLGEKGELVIGRHTFPAGARLLQADQLHPTKRGLVAIAQLVADELVERELARLEDFDFDLARVEGRLRPPLPVELGK